MITYDLFGAPIPPPASSMMAQKYGAPPFSVLSARDGDWQERKRQWLALGIQSELGRGDNLAAMGGALDRRETIKAAGRAAPGGSATPAATDYGANKARGDNRGGAI